MRKNCRVVWILINSDLSCLDEHCRSYLNTQFKKQYSSEHKICSSCNLQVRYIVAENKKPIEIPTIQLASIEIPTIQPASTEIFTIQQASSKPKTESDALENSI